MAVTLIGNLQKLDVTHHDIKGCVTQRRSCRRRMGGCHVAITDSTKLKARRWVHRQWTGVHITDVIPADLIQERARVVVRSLRHHQKDTTVSRITPVFIRH
jgi:hypothetical protein